MAQRTLFQLSRGSSLITVSIIGSAGRRGDADKMTKELYWSMVEKSESAIADVLKLDLRRVHLVSGGAAWADHLAVTLFLQEKAAALTLHIPAAWQSTGSEGKFEDNGKSSQSNPGRVANKLHKTFSEKIKEETLKQIECSRYMGAKLTVHNGFKKRNDSVAKSEYLIAFSWSEGEAPTKGGTLDTWSKCTGKKIHIPLSSLEKLTPAKARSYQEESCSSAMCFNSAEVGSSLPSTHAEPTAHNQCGDISTELPPSSSTVKKHPPCEYNSSFVLDSGIGFNITDLSGSAAGSIDSGIGSLDSLESAVSADETSLENAVSADKPQLEYNRQEEKRKRKRYESAEDSNVNHDGVHVDKTKQSLSKKTKLSDFTKQLLL